MGTVKQSGFQFSNPLLMEMSFSFNKEYEWQSGNELDTPIQMNLAKPKLQESGGHTALVLLTVEVGEDGPDFPYHVSVTMGADFKWDESLSPEMVDAMLSRNAPALLLGYIRPYIAQITGASPIGTVHIPFMNFAPQN